VITAARVRRLALVEPEAYEADHHGFPSYRVGGKIFATLPDVQRLLVMVGENEIHAWVAEQPAAYQPYWCVGELGAGGGVVFGRTVVRCERVPVRPVGHGDTRRLPAAASRTMLRLPSPAAGV